MPGRRGKRGNKSTGGYGKTKRFRESDNYHFFSDIQYYNTRYNFQPRWGYRKKRQTPEKQPSRTPSPFSGTEEYTLRKIQETSDMIKRQLMMPPETDTETVTEKPTTSVENPMEVTTSDPQNETVKNTKTCKRLTQYNVGEIHTKIINHITKLSHGKKVNLICANSSGYDVAIQQIQKQKRLELSKVLRDMCSNHTIENSEVINSIIPDIGIKIEDLPLEIIQELSSTLDVNFDNYSSQNDSFVSVKNENDDVVVVEPIKEVVDITDDMGENAQPIKFEIGEGPDLEIKESEIKEEMMDLPNETKIQASTQTESGALYNSTGTQTEKSIHFPITTNMNNLDNAIATMFTIDKEIARLTELRQSIFTNLQKKPVIKMKEILKLDRIDEKILVIENLESEKALLAASDTGKLFIFSSITGGVLEAVQVSEAPITSVVSWKKTKTKLHLLIGSQDSLIREYDYQGRRFLYTSNLGEGVQCMASEWNCAFIGTTKGSLMRFSLKFNRIEFSEKVSSDSILVLKATQEGARKVLLVGTRNAPVCVRDAMSGLHLRTMTELVTPTVYSLVLDKSMVYCGTTFHDILVFRFQDGSLVYKHQAANSKGISCMQVVKNLLFAGCYDGNIYVYNILNHEYIGMIQGPGGVILAMEVMRDFVIVGTMSLKFESVLIPDNYLEHNKI